MKLNEKIYTCRRKQGLSQEELALRIGVSRQSVSKWENGESSPEISKLPLLAKEFDVTTDWLLSEEDDVIDAYEPQPEYRDSNPSYPSWIEKLPKHMLVMIKRFGWIYGLVMAGQGLLVTLVGLFARTMFKTMILGNPMDNIIIEGDIPQDVMNSLILDPSNGFFTEFELQGWKMASMFTGFVIGLGIVFIIIGLIIAIALKVWGNNTTKEEF